MTARKRTQWVYYLTGEQVKVYKDILERIIKEGKRKPSGRDIPDTLSVFNVNYEVDLAEGFPLLTTKQVSFKNVVREILWYLSGDKSIKGHNIPFWEPWADPETGEVPSPYGYYWRRFPSVNNEAGPRGFGVIEEIDQIRNVINSLLTNPFSRRMIVTAWEPGNAWRSSLPPCHDFFGFNYDGERLNLHLTQRSCDWPIGEPYNLAGYSLLLHMICDFTGLTPGKFAHSIIDAHIYENQIESALKQLERGEGPLPTLVITRKVDSISKYKLSDFELVGYKHAGKLEYPVAV